MRALAVVCDKTGLQFTAVDSGGAVIEESDIAVPASRTDRCAQLGWLLEEAEALLQRLKPGVVYVRKAGSGRFSAASERHEVEGALQIAAHRKGISCELRGTEHIRASHLPKAKGAYAKLLKLPEVAARSNGAKRECYLYAINREAPHGTNRPSQTQPPQRARPVPYRLHLGRAWPSPGACTNQRRR